MEEDLKDDEICDVIQNYNVRMKQIMDEITSSYTLLATILNDGEKDDLITAVSMPGSNGEKQKDLCGVLLAYQKGVHSEVDSIMNYIRVLTDQKERINRIMEAFHRLPIQDQVIFRRMLPKDSELALVTYAGIATEINRSMDTVMRMKRGYIKQIKDNYGGHNEKENS